MMEGYMYNLSMIVRYSKLYAEQKLSSYHIGFPELSVLMYLSKNNHTNQEGIARHFMLDKGTIAKSILKLEQKGLVEKQRNAENKRENIISLTPGGEELMKYMRNIYKQFSIETFEGLSAEDLKQLDRITDQMLVNILKNKKKCDNP